MGHSSITVTLDRYGHLVPSLQERLAEGLDAAYRTAEKTRRTDPAEVVTIPSS
jgi:hypothetical protein